MDLEPTIVALGSGVAPGHRAIVRLSGEDCRRILAELLATPHKLDTDSARCFDSQACVNLRPESAQWVPVQCYWWPDSRSFTGEPCAEIHTIGSMPIAEGIVEACIRFGARQRNAVIRTPQLPIGQNRPDPSRSHTGRHTSRLRSSFGQCPIAARWKSLAASRALRDELVQLTGHVEAGLDFVEEDIEFIAPEILHQSLVSIQQRLQTIESQLDTRDGRQRQPVVVLVGLPNAGKSTLFNALLGEKRTIVSQLAGTTRDAVQADVIWGERSLRLVDTAGIEELSESGPRAAAQSVLQERIAEADVLVFCVDGQKPPASDWMHRQRLALESVASVIPVSTKSDLGLQAFAEEQFSNYLPFAHGDVQQTDRVRQEILQTISEKLQSQKSDALHHTAIRCKASLQRTTSLLQEAIANQSEGLGDEFVATDLRNAILELSSVIGEVHTEDLLGEIFGRFCIGK